MTAYAKELKIDQLFEKIDMMDLQTKRQNIFKARRQLVETCRRCSCAVKQHTYKYTRAVNPAIPKYQSI